MSAVARGPETTKPATGNDSLISTLMAFTAGFVDTCGFIALFGLFAAHVTGNFVLIGATLANPRPGIVSKLLAFPVFILVVAASQAFLQICKRNARDPACAMLLGQAFFLAVFMGLGIWASPVTDADSASAVLIGMFGVAAMAIQNVASRAVFTGHAPTTVMTGNVTQTVMDAVDVAFGADAAQARTRLRKMLPPVLGFAGGAILAGLSFVRIGFWCIAVALVAIGFVTWNYRHRSNT